MTKQTRNIRSLLGSHDPGRIRRTKKLHFIGVGDHDVYNVSAPFKIKRTQYILGRVESRKNEKESMALFFRKYPGSPNWYIDEKMPILDLQDPFLINLEDAKVIGGVEIRERVAKKNLSYRTVFFKVKDPHGLKGLAYGPWGMKGIRFTDLSKNYFGIFTRPQGKLGGKGKIGFTTIDSLSKLTSRTFSRAKIIEGQFSRGEWGGVNEIHKLKNGKVGVLGHIAKYSSNRERYYYPMVFCFDPQTREASELKIIATRNDLPDDDAKRHDLNHVVYPGGLIRNGNGMAKLYVGVGDANSYEITLEDPFLEYENS